MDPMDPMDCLWKPGTKTLARNASPQKAPETRLPFPRGTTRRSWDTARDQHSYSCLGALHVISSLAFVKRETTLIPSFKIGQPQDLTTSTKGSHTGNESISVAVPPIAKF